MRNKTKTQEAIYLRRLVHKAVKYDCDDHDGSGVTHEDGVVVVGGLGGAHKKHMRASGSVLDSRQRADFTAGHLAASVK